MVLKKCSICDRRFTKTEHCKRHERSHTRQKPYECPICHKRYSRSDVLGRHVKGHTAKANAAASANNQPPSPTDQEDPIAISPHTMTNGRRMSMQTNDQHVPSMNGDRPRMSSFHHPSLGDISMHGNGNGLLQSTPTLSNLQGNGAMNTISPTAQQHPLPSSSNVNHGWNLDFPLDDSQQNGEMAPNMQYGAALGGPPEQPAYNMGTMPQQSNHTNGNINDMLQSWLLHPESEGRSQSGSFDLAGAGIFGFDDDHMPPRHFTDPGGSSRQGDNIPNERFTRVEQCWLTRSNNVSRLMRNLWWEVIRADCDNIFSGQFVASQESQFPHSQGSRRGVDEEVRIRLQSAFAAMGSSGRRPTQFNIDNIGALNESSPGMADESSLGMDGASTQLTANSFPPAEILDMALDLYFRHFQPLVPFIHAPTYSTKATPLPLLFTQCLIGLVILGTTGASAFVSKAFSRTLGKISADMTPVALGSGSVRNFLSTIATAFLMLNLALMTGEKENLEQCQMLYTNLISVAQRHGLFAVSEGRPLDANQFESIQDPERKWKAWSRVESIKRMIAGLLVMDSFFSSFFHTSPVIRPDSVQIYLPSEDAVFQAISVRRWAQLSQGRNIIMPILTSTPGGTTLPKGPISPDSYSTFAIFSAIQLRICEAYHRLFGGMERETTQEQMLVPWRVYETDSRACVTAPLVMEVVNVYGDFFSSMNPNCLTLWHKMCIMLTADIQIFELAAGRAGAPPARKALDDIANWSQTPAARRACIHAAQTFRLLSNRKASDGITFHSAAALFESALILGLYVFMLPPNDPQLSNAEPIELMDDVDWKRLGNAGLTAETIPHTPTAAEIDPASSFVLNGGTIYISGILHQPGYQSARRVLLDYASLLKEVGKRSMRKFAKVLFIMSDVLMDVDGHEGEGHGPDEGL